ncbi:hypothetical protein LTS10_007961 [Elasticomyces elasticus]|nr:hypothetical protein LTS10_007961 [Elasticomyces elasticus]
MSLQTSSSSPPPPPPGTFADALQGDPTKVVPGSSGDGMDLDGKEETALQTRFSSLDISRVSSAAKGTVTGINVNLDSYEPGAVDAWDTLRTTKPKGRPELDPFERFKEVPKVQKMLDEVDELGTELGVETRHVHREYRALDQPKGYFMKPQQQFTHFGGSLRPESYKEATLVFWKPNKKFEPAMVFGHTAGHDEDVTSIVSLRYWTASQMPYIQLRIQNKDLGTEPRDVTFFADNLSNWSKDPLTMLTGASNPMKDRIYQKIGNKLRPKLVSAAKDHLVSELTLHVNHTDKDAEKGELAGKPRFNGSDRIVGTFARWADTMEGYLTHLGTTGETFEMYEEWKEAMTEDEQLLGLLFSNKLDFSVYTVYDTKDAAKQKPELIQITNFFGYFKAAMRLCQALGNYWYIKEQTKHDDINDIKSFGAVLPPRWMVKTWGPGTENWADDADDEIKAKPLTWAPFRASDIWPSASDLNMILKLAVNRERQYQAGLVKDVFAGEDHKIMAVFTKNPLSPMSYLVEFSTNLERATLQAALPQSDTAITVTVEGGNKLFGRLVEKSNSSKADFTAHVTSKSMLNFGTDSYPVSIDFRDDSTAFRRNMQALIGLQHGHPERLQGVHMGNLLLGEHIPKDHRVGHLDLTAAQRKAFEDEGVTWSLNTEQSACLTDTLNVPVLVIHGPPGTGKSKTILAIIEGYRAAGHKVLVCGPTNDSVSEIADSYDELSDKNKHMGKWMVWKGAYIKPGKGPSATTATTQSTVPVEEQDAYWAQLASEAREASDDKHLKRGLAHRRWLIVNWIATSGNHALEADARDYIELVNNMGSLSSKDRIAMMSLEAQFNTLTIKDQSVIFSTCSMSAHQTLVDDYDPTVLIIDESAAAPTPDLATPCVANQGTLLKIVLAGDHKQQPPVVTSQSCNEGYELLAKPLFETLVEGARPLTRSGGQIKVRMLTTQYRMHEDIASWPSREFYDGRLLSAPSTAVDNAVRKTLREFMANALRYFNCTPGGDITRHKFAIDMSHSFAKPYGTSTSPKNDGEAELIATLISELLAFEPKMAGTRRLTPADMLVVTPYTGQRQQILSALFAASSDKRAREVRVSTANNVQGSEAPIVFVSLTSNNEYEPAAIGFIYRKQQLNVELTRARDGLFLLGAFRNILQAIADKSAQLTGARCAALRSLLQDLHDGGDIITYHDFVRLMRGEALGLADTSSIFPTAPLMPGAWPPAREWPVSFEMSTEAKEVLEEEKQQVGDKRPQGNKFNTPIVDPASGRTLKSSAKPANKRAKK